MSGVWCGLLEDVGGHLDWILQSIYKNAQKNEYRVS
jgi:hypothetical protein